MYYLFNRILNSVGHSFNIFLIFTTRIEKKLRQLFQNIFNENQKHLSLRNGDLNFY